MVYLAGVGGRGGLGRVLGEVVAEEGGDEEGGGKEDCVAVDVYSFSAV